VTKLILNEELPRDLRRALDREAKRQNVTLNDVAGAILAKHYGGNYAYSGNPFRPVSSRFKLNVPDPLHRKIGMDALRQGHPMRGVVLSILASHLGAKPIDPKRRPRKELV
jgi:predicted HicB family RNase H-like nuclease